MKFRFPLAQVLNQEVTVKLVPHGGGATRNFRFTIASLFFFVLLSTGIMVASLHILPYLSQANQQISEKEQSVEEARKELQSVLQEIERVVAVSDRLESSLQKTMDGLMSARDGSSVRSAEGARGFPAALREESLNERNAVQKLEHLAETLRSGSQPLEDVQQAMALQEELLNHIPNRWPIVAGRGHVTMEYGPNIHPILDRWYLHKGMDITDTPGVPVVATAAGRVVKAEYDQFGYGRNIVVEHKYGFKTRYGHLDRLLVDEGDTVDAGERIGILGNTGTSTGPHVHFEVLLGGDVLDPSAFLKISNEFRRWRGNRN